MALPYLGRLLPRPRLRALLPPIAEGGTVAVVAGPGYGKTSFVADAAVSAGVGVAYHGLTAADRDPADFLSSLCSVLDSVHAGMGAATMRRLHECVDSEREVLSVTAELVEEMAAAPGGTYLVFDDVSEVEESLPVVSALALLLEALPSGWTCFVVSRRPLPFDLEPLRMQGRVVDIGLRQLRLTPSEVREWASEKWGLDIGVPEARQLWKLTEGWPVALALMGARYRARGGVRVKEDVVRAVGRGENLTEYLASRVFELLDPRAADVLLGGSLLPRVVFPRDAEYFSGPEGEALDVLAGLVEQGLLVTETGFETFTLHPLLKAYARRRLLALGDEYARNAFLRAAHHLELRGELLAAVSLYLEAGATDEVSRPLRLHVSRHLNAATTFACREWLNLVPADLAQGDPWLLLVRGRVLQDEGTYAEGERCYAQASRLLERAGDKTGLVRAHLGRCFCLFFSGRWEDSLAATEQAEAAATTKAERAEVLATRSNVLLSQCRWDEAAELFELALLAVAPEDRDRLEQRIHLYRSRLFFLRGQFPLAQKWASRAINPEVEAPRTTYAAALNTVATVEYLQGRYQDAELHAQAALALVRARGYTYLEAPALLSLAGVKLGLCEYRTSLEHAKRAQYASERMGDIEAVTWALDLQATLCRVNGNPSRALELHRRALDVVQENQLADYEAVRLRGGLGMDMAVLGDATGAEKTLTEVAAASRQMGLDASLAPALFYLGWLAGVEQDESLSARLLAECFDLFEKNRYLHFLAQEARVAAPVLALGWRLLGGTGRERFLRKDVLPRLPDRLRNHYEQMASGDSYPTDQALGRPRTPRRQLARARRPEPTGDDRELMERISLLTDREMEILRHIGSGLPNKVIAAKLFITEKTIKTHANHVYRKLEVMNRLQAVLALQKFEELVRKGVADRPD